MHSMQEGERTKGKRMVMNIYLFSGDDAWRFGPACVNAGMYEKHVAVWKDTVSSEDLVISGETTCGNKVTVDLRQYGSHEIRHGFI